MSLRFISMIAAVSLLAACESAPEEKAVDTGAGQAGTAPAAAAPAPSPVPSIVPGSQADLVANVGDRVFFGFDKYDLTGDSRAMLEKQAAWLKTNPAVRVSVEGHADERGTREYNLALGERRANSVKDYLVALGVQPSRINTISYGKERPVALGSNEAAWSQNRRGVTVVAQ